MFDDILCIIPARGGSKSIKDKNLQLLGEYTLVEHSIIHAIEAGIPRSNIVITSDDDRILEIVRLYEDVVDHFRSDELSSDKATTESAMLDVMDKYPDFNTIVLLQPTSPIRFKGRVKDCIMKYKSGDYNSLLTTTKMYNFFWYEQESWSSEYSWVQTMDSLYRPRRQELKREHYRYFDNGNIYISDAQLLRKLNRRLGTGNEVCVYPITELEGMQIDTPQDLIIFRAIFGGGFQGLINERIK